MDRELIRPEHYRRYTGHQVEVRLYKSLDGVKNINGTLDGLEGDTVTITDENGKKWDLDFNDIARTKLAVIF